MRLYQLLPTLAEYEMVAAGTRANQLALPLNQDLVLNTSALLQITGELRVTRTPVRMTGLFAFTAGDRDPLNRELAPSACIDHIPLMIR